MYVVRNLLKSTLRLADLDVSLGPREYLDLEKAAPERFAASQSLCVALAEGYLVIVKNDRPDRAAPDGVRARPAPLTVDSLPDVSRQLAEIKELLAGGRAAGGDLQEALVAEMRAAMAELKAVRAEREQVLSSEMDEVEMRARMTLLERRESELAANFQDLGRKVEQSSDADKMADLLDDI